MPMAGRSAAAVWFYGRLTTHVANQMLWVLAGSEKAAIVEMTTGAVTGSRQRQAGLDG